MSRIRWFLAGALVLLLAMPVGAQYNVRIENVPDICPSTRVSVDITIEPGAPDPQPLGGFDLHISFNSSALSFMGAFAGDFYAECGWEYFTYNYGTQYPGCCLNCPSVQTLRLVGIAETNNGPIHPSCFTPVSQVQLAEVSFFVTGSAQYANTTQPINFYWLPGGNCGLVAFSSQSGNDLFIAQSVFDHTGQPFAPGFNCSGPDSACAGTGVIPYINYYSGSVGITEQDFAYRGDINLNGNNYEISDAILFANYFIYGLSVFTINPPLQIAATEINCDGLTLSVGDLVYLIRIIVGDAQPFCTCAPQGAALAVANSTTTDESLTDTLAFFGAQGYQGQQHIPFDIYVANSVPIAGLQARMVFDPACVTPAFDLVIGDGESVEYALVGRAANYLQDNGNIIVKSVEPGVLLVYMYPTFGAALPVIGAGSDVMLKVYFNANPPITPIEGPVEFVTEGYDYNLFADLNGQAILPTLVGGTFRFVAPPSCPVLFSFDGYDFVMENPLLTECEESGYRDVVTDHYLTRFAVPDASGAVRFQLRELEDEVTLLDDIELLTVDYPSDQNITCDAGGRIRMVDRIVRPVSAVDNFGNDQLAQVHSEDGMVFAASGPGHLIVEFDYDRTVEAGVLSAAGPKRPCAPNPMDPLTKSSPMPLDIPDLTPISASFDHTVTLEVLGEEGHWVALDAPPVREQPVSQAVWINQAQLRGQNRLTVRVSWTDSYTTDAVSLSLASSEEPEIDVWKPTEINLHKAISDTYDADLLSSPTVKLLKGDVYEVSFNPDRTTAPGFARAYVFKATGRYHPAIGNTSDLHVDGFQLFDNYPNPFNPTTSISFYLPKASYVRLQVFNSLGQRVATLVNEVQSAGSHTVEWSGADHDGKVLASGAYFYRLESVDFKQTKKMLYLK